MRYFKAYLLIVLLTVTNSVFGVPNFPELTGRVVDQANILSAAQQQNIIAQLKAFEEKSNAQIVVASIDSLEGYEIRDYGYQLGRHWQIGQKDLNNGVLLLIAPNERKVAIEVGYGLEGSLTDALSHQIIEQYILPKFRQGDMGAGVELGVMMILKGLAGEISAENFVSQAEPEIDLATAIFMLLFFGFIVFFIIQAIRHGGGGGGLGGDGSSSSGSRHSSWGGSSGGFSGGGGSFGGGGASGGW